ncbi:MAG: sigma 54-interacting transcriptional regulator [Deltaproteobacteria bacterium]
MLPHGYDGFWEKVIETLTEGLVVVDHHGTIIAVNQAMEEITGYCREELVGQPCSLIRTDACFGHQASGRERQCQLFQTGATRNDKCALVKKDGSLVHVLKNAVLLNDHNGEILAGVETFNEISELIAKERVITRLRRELSRENGFQGILGQSPAMLRLFSLISSAAQSDAPVIIYGESGTGKELVASALHRLGPRSQGPFIRVNSAALHESLLESELFGHVKGAFTGADRTRVGRFEAAHGGDIFLDEVGDLPMATQIKLLRVLQEKVIERVGEQRPIPVDVRVITATNQDLHQLRVQNLFRDDLFYRINVIPIHLPPLRDRREDIPLLVEAFIERTRLKTRKLITGISKEALEKLLAYPWPGNVRELINVIHYAFVLCHEKNIQPEHLPALDHLNPPSPLEAHRKRNSSGKSNKEQLIAAITAAEGCRAEAARRLGISRVTLWKWLKKHDIKAEEIISNKTGGL